MSRFVLEIGFDAALELDRHWITGAIAGGAGGDAHPALADAVFLDIGFFDAFEADADATLEQGGIEIGAVRVVGETVWRGVAHSRSEEHTSELQSLLRTSSAAFCLQTKKQNTSAV